MKGFESTHTPYVPHVGGKREEPLLDTPVPNTVSPENESDPEMRAYEATAREYVDTILYSGKMQRFLGEEVSFELGKSGSGFYFDPTRKKINLDPLWFMERNLSPRMVEWAMYHEGRHTLDRKEDTEHFDAAIGYCIEKAKSCTDVLVQKWQQSLDISNPEQQQFFESLTEEVKLDPERTETAPRVVLPLIKVYFTILFNSLDDIWVNKGIPSIAPIFENETEGGTEVQELYRTVLFKDVDYRNVSHVEQFAYALLRGAMVPDEKVVVNDAVAEELTMPRKYLGQSMTAADVVETFLVPRQGKDTSYGKRKEQIEKYLMDSFDRLVQKDIDAWTPQYTKPEEGDGQGEGSGNGEKGNPQAGQPFDDVIERHQKQHEIDHLSPEDMKKIEKAISEGEKKKKNAEQEAKLTPEERAKQKKARERSSRATQEATENGTFNQPKYQEIMRSVEEYERHKARITPQIEALAQLWRSLIGRGKELRMIRERFHAQGKLDVKAFINQYPTLMRGEINESYEPRVFEKRIGQIVESITPEEIRVYLNLDLSGSMKDDPQKMQTLKEITVLLNEAFKYFGTMVLNEKESLMDEHVFRVRFEVRGYSEASATLLSAEHAWVDEALLMSELNASGGGGTNSSTALQGVAGSLQTLDPEDAASGKVKILLFDITDGETDGVDTATSIVNDLTEKYKVITNPLYLGEGDAQGEDTRGFDTMKQIYGEDTERVTMETIINVLTRRLENELRDMAV